MFSRQFKSSVTLEDSFQFLSTSMRKRFSDGQVMRSLFFSSCWHIGQSPADEVLQLERRHSLHILCAQGVRTGSSADSRHIGHSAFSPLRIPSTTSSTYARVRTLWLGMTESGLVSRNILASLFRSANSCESPRQQVRKANLMD
ncbi:hypothetical protein U1Q18_049336 [Sarracenia purpurea var. burkii]